MSAQEYKQIIQELHALEDVAKAKVLSGFFKTGKGEYGEGDTFLGIPVPVLRKVARKHLALDQTNVKKLIENKVHEVRSVGFMILVEQFRKADVTKRKEIVDFYLQHKHFANNWDFVDGTAPQILGEFLLDKERKILYNLAESESLWDRRIAVVATYALIKKNLLGDTLALAEVLMNDAHDLMHKAVGWMLREVGKKDEKALRTFLDRHAKTMPRTMLRYAIEKFDEKDRKQYMRK